MPLLRHLPRHTVGQLLDPDAPHADWAVLWPTVTSVREHINCPKNGEAVREGEERDGTMVVRTNRGHVTACSKTHDDCFDDNMSWAFILSMSTITWAGRLPYP